MTGKGCFALLTASGLVGTLVGGVFPTVAAGAGPPPNGPVPNFLAVDRVVEHLALESGNVSASIAVARGGRVVHVAAFGHADPATAAVATPATRYRVASISKTFAALAVRRLATEERLDLDAPMLSLITRRLPKLSVRDKRVSTITARQLLTQSSGLPTAWGLYFATGAARTCPEAATRALSGQLVDDPGASYRYSNTNYCILGLVIEAVTGETFDAYVARTVLAPLGVTDAHITTAPGDYRAGDAWQPAPPESASLGALGAAGEWVATPTDLVRIFDALARPECGSSNPSPAALAARPGPWVKPDDTDWYGLGVMVWDGGASWGHSGTIEGGRAIVEHDADGTTWAITVSGTKPRVGEDLRASVTGALTGGPAAGRPLSSSGCPPTSDSRAPRGSPLRTLVYY
jgi:D-alanyl-D-alanine carboxypeptidase